MPCDVSAEHIGPCGPDCLIHDYFGGYLAKAEAAWPDRPDVTPPGQQHFLVAIRHSEIPVAQQWQFVMGWAEEWQEKVDALVSALQATRQTLSVVLQKAPGYDWNADPMGLTLVTGAALTKADEALAAAGAIDP